MQKEADELTSYLSDFNKFCDSLNPDLQYRYGCDPQHAVFCQSPMLCVIDQAYGDGAAAQWLVPQLVQMCASVGVNKKLDDFQMQQLALSIRNEFGFLKATEVMLFLWRLKDGHYGEFFGSVDSQRVMRALRGPFNDERAKMIDDAEKEKERAWRDSLYTDPARGKRKENKNE